MNDDRRFTLATILGMTQLSFGYLADDLAAGKLDADRTMALANTLNSRAWLLGQHVRTAATGHPAVGATPTRR